ncbi:hypothetical protein PCANC_25137 [Puccinia coronata f. sp. avenae]|uniref:Uncharacterized protein n=1 Tax=Puccinia coronata f. sp. avenae TaxID=200324 RepID=A0A2N5U0M3_9BASI|nr:hypothetical protein PCANC_25137 [Puccinia coronata f. sp. avenae]
MVPDTNAKTHWPEGEHDLSKYNKDHESSSGNDHELVMTSRSRSSNGVRTPLNDRYRLVIKKNQSSRGARLLLMTGLHQPLRGGVLLLMAEQSSRGVRTPLNDRDGQESTPINNPGRPVIKRSTPPLDERTALAIERRRPPLDGQSVLVIERKEASSSWSPVCPGHQEEYALLLVTRTNRLSRGAPARWAGTSSASR